MRVELRDGDGDELRRRGRSERDAAARDRCRAVLLAGEGTDGQGQTGERIAAAVGRSKRWVDKWLARYRRLGLAGLAAGKARGNEPSLTPEELARFKARMKAPSAAADGGKVTLRGKDARRILADEFGKPMALGSAYRVLHRAGLSCLRPRPRHRKNDPEKMAAWLGRAPLLSAT
jgi:transposase